jgi:tetratricopeptide (TPR) repeat protein
MIVEADDEMQAQELIKRGEIDQAIAIYEQLKPESADIFNTIGVLYSDMKGDYDSAIIYHKKALKIQDEVNHHPLIFIITCLV